MEAILSMVLVSMVIVAAMSAVGATARARSTTARSRVGPDLARQLMTEVLMAHYEEPGPETPAFGREAPEVAAARDDWDDVDDYNGWSRTPPEYKDASPVPNAAGWTREITVRFVDPTSPATGSGSDQGLKEITVTVIDPTGRSFTLTSLRSRSGTVDTPPPVDTTYVSWVGVELQIGGDTGDRVSSGTDLLNSVPDAGGG